MERNLCFVLLWMISDLRGLLENDLVDLSFHFFAAEEFLHYRSFLVIRELLSPDCRIHFISFSCLSHLLNCIFEQLFDGSFLEYFDVGSLLPFIDDARELRGILFADVRILHRHALSSFPQRASFDSDGILPFGNGGRFGAAVRSIPIRSELLRLDGRYDRKISYFLLETSGILDFGDEHESFAIGSFELSLQEHDLPFKLLALLYHVIEFFLVDFTFVGKEHIGFYQLMSLLLEFFLTLDHFVADLFLVGVGS